LKEENAGRFFSKKKNKNQQRGGLTLYNLSHQEREKKLFREKKASASTSPGRKRRKNLQIFSQSGGGKENTLPKSEGEREMNRGDYLTLTLGGGEGPFCTNDSFEKKERDYENNFINTVGAKGTAFKKRRKEAQNPKRAGLETGGGEKKAIPFILHLVLGGGGRIRLTGSS